MSAPPTNSRGELLAHVTRFGAHPRMILHVPHASVFVDDDVRAGIVLDDDALTGELAHMTDHATDAIAAAAAAAADVGAVVWANCRSRLVVDPERFPDEREPMAAVGMGAVYTATHDLGVLRRPDPDRDAELLERFFHPYASAFADHVDELLDDAGAVTIIDVHSYPTVRLPYELAGDRARPGICIGTDATHTPTWLRDAAATAFDGVTDEVAFDTPFAGTYVPLRHYGTDTRVTSVMVEIRRDLYGDGTGDAFHGGAGAVIDGLARLMASVGAHHGR